MRTVHVIQDVPGKNILPAQEFGKLHVILSGKEPIHQAIEELSNYFYDKWANGDMLLLIGSPIYIGVAFHAVAIVTNGKIPVLVWDRHQYRYNAEVIEV